MRTAALLASFGVFSLAVASTSASAQVGIGVYVGPSGPAEPYYEYAPAYRPVPRVYGYARRYDGVTVERPYIRRGGCWQDPDLKCEDFQDGPSKESRKP